MNNTEIESAFKSRLSLRPDELDLLSTYLTKKWKMFCFAETTDTFQGFVKKNLKAFKAFDAILIENEAKKDQPSSYSPKNQRLLYDKLARAPFGPWTMGARWPQILSSLAAVDKLCSVIRPKRVLEIGCGTGFAYDWLRSKHNFRYTGIDFSSAAIEIANRSTKPGQDDVFQVADINTYETQDTFDLIFSIAGFPRSLDAKLIDQASRWLSDEGFLYAQVPGHPGPASRWTEKPASVQLVFEDWTGGLEFPSYYAHTCNFVFARKKREIEPHIYSIDASWSEFATCMNSGRIHERERNFGYFNSNGRPTKHWPFEEGKWELE